LGSMRPHEWFIEHRVDYATRVLERADIATFDAHLHHCEECRREIQRIEEELAWLPMAMRPVAPPPGFRRRVIQRILDRSDLKARRWRMAAALAASLLLATVAWYAGSHGKQEALAHLAEQEARVAALEDTLAIIQRASRVVQANLEMDGRRGALVIFADEVSHRWNVVVHGLPPAPPGKRYQFWFICDDGMVRGAEINPGQSGRQMFTTGMPEGGGTVLGAALTVEPMESTAGPPRGKELAHVML
jgi:anti-sigma-K factor RskA